MRANTEWEVNKRIKEMEKVIAEVEVEGNNLKVISGKPAPKSRSWGCLDAYRKIVKGMKIGDCVEGVPNKSEMQRFTRVIYKAGFLFRYRKELDGTFTIWKMEQRKY